MDFEGVPNPSNKLSLIIENALSGIEKALSDGAEHRARTGDLNLGKVDTVSLDITEIQTLILRVLDALLKDC